LVRHSTRCSLHPHTLPISLSLPTSRIPCPALQTSPLHQGTTVTAASTKRFSKKITGSFL
jgi:hypothetical protein